MAVVLPREADPAVQLDVELRAAHERGQCLRGGDGGRQFELGRAGLGARAASHTAAVASWDATSMFAAWCFTAW